MVETATASQQERLDLARRALAGAGRSLDGGNARPYLPLVPLAQEVFTGGVKRGSVVSVRGCMSIALATAAQVSCEGEWVAMVGVSHVGLAAAAQAGIDLSRTVVIPDPGTHAPQVLATCMEGMGVVMVGPQAVLTASQRRRLLARVRESGAVVVALGPWEQAAWDVAAVRMQVKGVGAGTGRLREYQVTMRVTPRGRPPRHTTVSWSQAPVRPLLSVLPPVEARP